MFGFKTKNKSSISKLSEKDKALVYITNEIPNSKENKHWRCPGCDVELEVSFQGGTDGNEQWKSTFVSCPKCKFQSVTDGTGNIPQWWLDKNKK